MSLARCGIPWLPLAQKYSSVTFPMKYFKKWIFILPRQWQLERSVFEYTPHIISLLQNIVNIDIINYFYKLIYYIEYSIKNSILVI